MSDTETADLSGLWDGQFSYPAARPPTPFQASLLDVAGAISGNITEKSTLPPREGEPLYAVVRGRRDGSEVRFAKSYESDDPRYHVVDYDGQISSDGTEIEGVWRTAGWEGRFLMIRASRRQVAVERMVEELVR